MENVDMFNAATAPLTFHDFLDRMRHPQAFDLVKSIKSFIVEFTSRTPDADKDSESVQAFLTTTEGAFEAHPLFVDATDEELDSAGEGLEKYLMTKLFSRAFAPFPEEVEHDQRLSEKMAMLQQFIRPEHLDIPPNFHESSWLLAQKELQKINTYKAPRDKLVCILNCCRVINNLLLNVSIGSKDNPPGADDFLPVLIYVVIKANPPQLHSNLLYINRYRHHSRLVSEAAYFYTNLVSAEHFIDNLEATSLSIDSAEFEKQMQSARALLDVNLSAQPSGTEKHPPSSEPLVLKPDEHASPRASMQSVSKGEPGPGLSVQKEDQVESRMLPVESAALAASAGSAPVSPKDGSSEKHNMTVAQLEASALPEVLEAEKGGELARDYRYLFANAGDLRVMDVEGLLSDYKELVLKYVALCKAVNTGHFVKEEEHNEEVETTVETEGIHSGAVQELSEPMLAVPRLTDGPVQYASSPGCLRTPDIFERLRNKKQCALCRPKGHLLAASGNPINLCQDCLGFSSVYVYATDCRRRSLRIVSLVWSSRIGIHHVQSNCFWQGVLVRGIYNISIAYFSISPLASKCWV